MASVAAATVAGGRMTLCSRQKRDGSTMLEISVLFDKTPKDKKLDSVELAGIKFKTW